MKIINECNLTPLQKQTPVFLVGPPHFNWDFFLVNSNGDKPFFVNELYKIQKTNFNGTIDKEQPFVLCFYRDNDRFLVQVLFNDTAKYSNNSYAIYFWDKIDFKSSFCCEYPSHIVYPKVWDCVFVRGLIDCVNYFAIQMVINRVMKAKNVIEFELDLDKTKRDTVMVTQKQEEIEKLIKEGKSYQIISLKAELQNFEVKLNCSWDK